MPRALALLAVASLTLTSCLVGNPVLSDMPSAPTAAPSLTDIAYGPARGCENAAVDAPCGGSQLLDIYPATAGPSRGTIVWIHGGGLFLGDKSVPDSAGPVFEQLERGWSVVSVNYRLLRPKSPPRQSTTVPATAVTSTVAPSSSVPTTGVPSTAAPSTTSPATTAVPSTTATSATPPQTTATDTPTTTVTPTTSTPPATGSTTGTTVLPDSDTGAGSGAADATTAMARRIVRPADSYENTYPTALRDVISAVDWVKANGADHGLDTSKLVLAGHSAGGMLAAMIGLGWNSPSNAFFGITRPDAWVAMAAPMDFTSPDVARMMEVWLGPHQDRLARPLSPLSNVDAADPPGYVAHGDMDNVVSVHHAMATEFVFGMMDLAARVRVDIVDHDAAGGPLSARQRWHIPGEGVGMTVFNDFMDDI